MKVNIISEATKKPMLRFSDLSQYEMYIVPHVDGPVLRMKLDEHASWDPETRTSYYSAGTCEVIRVKELNVTYDR